MIRIRNNSTRHGKVFEPQSRVMFLVEEGKIGEWIANSLEAGKFFPATQGGLTDPLASTDAPSAVPPADGKIASAGFGGAEILDQPGTHWRKHKVKSGDTVDFRWSYSARHLTRRWNYFITKKNWNPNALLSRAQFE